MCASCSWFKHYLSGLSSDMSLNGKALIKKCCFLVLFLSCAFSGGFCDMATVPLGFEINALARDKNWVSKNGVFAFGFLEKASDDDIDEYVVGIKYNLGGNNGNVPVWTVGGGLTFSINTTFGLAIDGRLVLMRNPSGTILWSSNTSNLGVQKATLLDNGNLVLLSTKNEVIWESFTSPTNTLLPGQSLRYPKSLRASSMSPILSYYSLTIGIDGELQLVWEHNVTYWRSHSKSKEARFDSSGVLGLYDDSNRVVWSVSSRDYGDTSITLRHLRIDQDGNLRIYSWDSTTQIWKAVWQAVQDQCDVFGTCGLYSVCGYNSSGPVCNCLYSDSFGYGTDNSFVKSGSMRCKGSVDLGNCRMHTSMFEMKRTVLYGLYPSQDIEMLLSEAGCREYCSNDTACLGSTSMNDGSGRCTIKRTSYVSGYMSPHIQSVSFLKVCSVPQAAATLPRSGGSIPSSDGEVVGKMSGRALVGAISIIVLLTVSAVLSIQILVFWFLYRRRKVNIRSRIPFSKDAWMNPHYSALVRLSFEEIKELTNDFVEPLGDSVYKGALPNKVPIVAKLLKDVAVSEKEFRVVVSMLSGTFHRNLVLMKGFCFEAEKKVLVYEYVPNGSLDKWILNPKEEEKSWQQKLDMALGVARAVAYLHSECQKCIAHGNLKLENVLLDENMVPKVTGFGLNDLFVNQSAASSSESPSERDIYKLGEMFLQMVTCRRDVADENMQQIMEEKSVDGDSLQVIERMTRIAFWCMQKQPFLRPSIGEIVKVLEGTLSVDQPPSWLGHGQSGGGPLCWNSN